MRAEPYYELRCAAGIDLLTEKILRTVSHIRMSDEETQLLGTKMRRMQRLEEYIQEHYAEPLRLTDLARKEGLTLNYLSHFFRDCFGVPFQTYLLNLRCRAAAQMLTQTDLSVSEVSYACGFSALKYMNRGFLDQYGVKPGEYRTQFGGSRRSAEQTVQPKDAGEPVALQRFFFPPALPHEEGLAHLTRALQRGF